LLKIAQAPVEVVLSSECDCIRSLRGTGLPKFYFTSWKIDV